MNYSVWLLAPRVLKTEAELPVQSLEYIMMRFGYKIQYNLDLELSISSIVFALNHFLGRFFGA